jgi:hypothetical protein
MRIRIDKKCWIRIRSVIPTVIDRYLPYHCLVYCDVPRLATPQQASRHVRGKPERGGGEDGRGRGQE